MELWLIQYPIAFIGLFMAVLISLIYLKNTNRIKIEKKRKPTWEPKVTILIPVYNEAEYIGGCLKSICKLDYPTKKLEVLVIDDGSTDHTVKIAQSYKKNKQKIKIKIIKKQNTGKADTLNYGIKLAKNELIATLDGDSYVSPYSLKRMLSYFDSEDVGAVASAVKVKKAANIIEEVQRIEYLFAIFSRKIMNFICSVQVTPGPFSIFKKSVLVQIGGFDTKSLVEDQEIALKMQKHGYKINSAINCDVYTEIPRNFFELMKQRTRWQRGGFWNTAKYLDLINPKYGDLGVIIIPFSIFGYVTLVTGVGLLVYALVRPPYYGTLVGLEAVLLNINPIYVFILFWFVLVICWFYFGVRKMLEYEKWSLFSIILFIFLYPLLTTIFWFSALYTQIKEGGKNTW